MDFNTFDLFKITFSGHDVDGGITNLHRIPFLPSVNLARYSCRCFTYTTSFVSLLYLLFSSHSYIYLIFLNNGFQTNNLYASALLFLTHTLLFLTHHSFLMNIYSIRSKSSILFSKSFGPFSFAGVTFNFLYLVSQILAASLFVVTILDTIGLLL